MVCAAKTPSRQLELLDFAHTYNFAMDFVLEIAANAPAVFVHYPFWTTPDICATGISDERKLRVLGDIARVWHERFPAIELCCAECTQ